MWPEGMRCAAAFTFDFDAEEAWLGEDPANADRPGVLSQGTYSAKWGVPLILELLERHAINATFFVPGRVAERHAGRIEEIVAAGHELAHHGYTHTSPSTLSRDEERSELVKGLEVLRAFSPDVVGYRSPSWDFSANTEALLQELGFRYSSNFMDDLKPYRRDASDLIELPVQWILADTAYFWFDGTQTIRTADDVRSIWEGEFRGYHRAGGSFVLACHPQVIGRPYRLEMLDAFLTYVRSHDDVWIATCREIVDAAPSDR
ncbi:MAG: polysaccharide deacetylase family protein [Actinomycetota bacterium]